MKKLLIILAIVGLIKITNAVYYDTKLVEAPIVVAGEVDFSNNNIKLSYITNSLKPHEFQSIEIGGQHYFPEQPFSMFGEETPLESYVTYTYYSVYSPIIWLGDDENMTPLVGAREGTIHFKDGRTETVALTSRDYVKISELQSTSSSTGSHGTAEFYKVQVPFTLKQVNVIEDRVDIVSLQVNQKEVPLPLTAPIALAPQDTLYIATTDGEARFEMELYKMELHIVNEAQQEQILELSQYLNTRPSEDWVNQLVKERGDL
ncbi:MAG: hypothetical protein ABS949_10595 [Solibacillus sp.]